MNYYAFHIGDYAAHTAHLDPLEDIAYRRLIDCYMLAETPLPSDPADCARRIRMREHVAAVEGVLREFFALTDGGWRHKRCDAEIGRAQEKSQKARESAGRSWDSRRSGTAVRTHSERIANAMRDGCEGNAPNTQDPIPITQEEQIESAKPSRAIAADAAPSVRGSRIPEGFPDAPALAWCRAERPDLQAEAVCEKFRDYWAGVPGQRGRKVDWPATWRNFVRSERVPQQARASPADARRERESQFIRELTGRHHDDRTIIDAEPYFARIA
jgi:uncharacterized protein YdaU (DUF1376 family)